MTLAATVTVCSLDEIEPGTARRVDVGGQPVAIVRIDDDVYAIGDTCSHAEVSLSGGEVWCDERELECPKHGSSFSLETGEPSILPATQPVPVFDASVVDGQVIVTVAIDPPDPAADAASPDGASGDADQEVAP